MDMIRNQLGLLQKQIQFFQQIFFIILLFPSISFSLSFLQQRSWTMADGLEESNTYNIVVTSTGNLYAVHGTEGKLSLLDGYRIQHIPAPDNHAKLVLNASGELWTVMSEDELIYSSHTLAILSLIFCSNRVMSSLLALTRACSFSI